MLMFLFRSRGHPELMSWGHANLKSQGHLESTFQGKRFHDVPWRPFMGRFSYRLGHLLDLPKFLFTYLLSELI